MAVPPRARGAEVADNVGVVVRLPNKLPTVSVAVFSAALTCAANAAAQTAAARPTGIFLRSGVTVSGFDLASMTFRLQDRSAARSMTTDPPSFTGKQLSLGREWLAGGSVGAHVDGPWFYVRIGADFYANPDVIDGFSIRSTTLGWIGAGPRFVFGSFAVMGGVRVGALLVDMAYRHVDGQREYSGLGALYGLDLGAQWRPLRWVQVDLAVGQDLFGSLTATTFALSANIGWSALAR